jgi:hypothetical protein
VTVPDRCDLPGDGPKVTRWGVMPENLIAQHAGGKPLLTKGGEDDS